jgi:hypothetical protein
MIKPLLSQEENLFDFFHEAVGSAVSTAGGRVSDNGIYYLSNLLVERGRSSDVVLPQTLVELQIKAMERGGSEAAQAWRELGDRALYVSGFFRPSLARKNVSVEYYQAMGATAYDHLASLMRWTGVSGGFDKIYEELAHQFQHCSTVIRRVRAQVRKHSDADILKLYEEWILNPDPVIAEQLDELGVDPFRLKEDLGC